MLPDKLQAITENTEIGTKTIYDIFWNIQNMQKSLSKLTPCFHLIISGKDIREKNVSLND